MAAKEGRTVATGLERISGGHFAQVFLNSLTKNLYFLQLYGIEIL